MGFLNSKYDLPGQEISHEISFAWEDGPVYIICVMHQVTFSLG